MARERYLVGVTPEELEKQEELRPNTFGGWVRNFWYHHKWKVLGITFAAVVLTVLFVQLFTREKADYTICLVTRQEMSRQAVERLEREFAALGKDRNGDGKVTVTVEMINVGDALGSQRSNTQHTAVQGKLMSREVYLFALDPTYYTETVAPNVAAGQTFFLPLGVQGNGVSEDGTYWNWAGCPLLHEADLQEIDVWQAAPAELYFGVRNLTANEAEVRAAEEHLELLRAFIAAQS